MRKIICGVTILAIAPVTMSLAQSRAPAKPVVAIVATDDQSGNNLSSLMTSKIGEAITATGRFTVTERQRLGALMSEQTLAKGGVVTTNTPGKVGGFEGADYVIYGTIGQISFRPASDLGTALLSSLASGGRSSTCTTMIVTMPLSLRITDANSGIVKYQSRIESSWKSPTACNNQSPRIDTNALMSDASNKAAAVLVTAIYPMQIAAVQSDGVLILNYGEGTLKPNQILVLYLRGNEIRDPTTGDLAPVSRTPG